MKSICLVIPVYNEQENLARLHERLTAVFDTIRDRSFEVLFVDDHSTDQTSQLLQTMASKDPRIRWLRLSRNRGSHIACAAGIEHCSADAVIIMAADLQDPPELIPELLAKHAEGYHLVWAVRTSREGETWLTRKSSECFYWLMNRLTELKLPPKGADVFLADRRVIKAFCQIPERNISLFALLSWLGFRQASIAYVKQARFAGHSKWTLGEKFLLAINSLLGFSYLPLRLMSYIGMLVAGAGCFWAAALLIMRLLGIMQTIVYAPIMILLLVLGGLQMIMFGVLGEYLWRTLDEARKRPRYFVEASSDERS